MPDIGLLTCSLATKNPVSPDVKDSYCGGKGCLPAPVDSVNLVGRDFKGGQMARDMNLFVDDDGTAYHIYSSEENSTLHISKLTDDYLSYSGQYFRAFVGRYMEGATLFKTKWQILYHCFRLHGLGSQCSPISRCRPNFWKLDRTRESGNWNRFGNYFSLAKHLRFAGSG